MKRAWPKGDTYFFAKRQSHSINLGGTLRTLAYRWDEGGNRTRITHPGPLNFDYSYDALGRLTAIRDPIGSQVITEGYSPQGPRNARGRPGGASGFQQDALGRPTSLTHYLGAPLDVQWTFAPNPAGQIASVTRSNDAYAWTGHYAVNRAYTTNGRNQYSAAGSAAFQYDANGNLTSDGTNAYLYDVENRLVGAPARRARRSIRSTPSARIGRHRSTGIAPALPNWGGCQTPQGD